MAQAKGKTKKRKKNEPRITEAALEFGIKPDPELDPKERCISPNEAGRACGVTGEAVKQWIYHQRLPAVKLPNGYWKIMIKDLEAFMRARYTHKRRVLLMTKDPSLVKSSQSGDVESLDFYVVDDNLTNALIKSNNLMPALYVVDVSAGMPGWEFIKKIRSTRQIKNIPVLAVTKACSKADEEKALNLGVQGFLVKPGKDEMAREIKGALQRMG